MIKIPIKKIENTLDIRLKRNFISIGVDTATLTGICHARTDNKDLYLIPDLLDMHKVKNQKGRFDIAYNYFTNFFKTNKTNVVIVEDVFFGRNVKALIFMARIGMVVYVLAKQHNLPVEFIMATSSRSRLNLQGRAKKQVVQEEFCNVTGIEFADDNVIDGCILAICGLTKE